jgi:hypothetical protein
VELVYESGKILVKLDGKAFLMLLGLEIVGDKNGLRDLGSGRLISKELLSGDAT